jgi:hypothetical protein
MQENPAGAIYGALLNIARQNELWLIAFHLVCAACVIGSVVSFDLRVLGFGKQIPVRSLHNFLIPLALLMALPAAASGALLFGLHAAALIGYGPFVVKIVALFLAAINAMIFFTGPYQTSKAWEMSGVIPTGAKVCALISIVLLAGIAICGVHVASSLALPA